MARQVPQQLSIEWKIPIVGGFLLLAAIVAVLSAGYLNVRQSAEQAAFARLPTLVGQLVDGMHRQEAALGRAANRIATDTAIAQYYGARTTATAAQASKVLRALRTTDSTLLAVQLCDTARTALLADQAAGVQFPRLGAEDLPHPGTASDSAQIGRFRGIGDTIVFSVAATIRRDGRVVGYFVEWRLVRPDVGARERTASVLGSGAAVFMGSAHGAWTDQVAPVAAPPIDVTQIRETARYQRDGVGRRFAAARVVPDTPWIVLVEFPEAEILAPARHFLGQVALIALFVFAAGLFAAWTFSRQLTAPLRTLTLAARRMESDRRAEPVVVDRGDELGQLANAFNQMVARVAAETQARDASEAQWRVLFERNPHPMWIYLLDTLNFVAVNDAAVLQYGWSRQQFLGRSIYAIQPPEDVPLVEERVARARLGADAHLTARQMKQDGTIFEAEIHSHSTEFAGRPARVVLAQDLSQRQALERQLRQAQKMEAVGRLAGGVAHDFNNILLVISAYSEMMRDASVANPVHHAELTEIIDAVRRGRSLTRQLLAFSRQQLLQPVVLDPNLAVTEVEGMLRRLIGEHIEVVVRLAPDLGRILADPGQLQQVLLNLAVNGRDAMPDGGKLTITTANVDVDEANRAVHGLESVGEFVTISVSDTGIGMTAEVRAKIFEPFFTTKGPGQGTGLGLATVYGIVTQSGGTVTVYTEPGHGALFRIYLPRVHDGTLARRPAERSTNTGGTETILLVEDERAVRAAAAGMLKHLGYTVLIAEHGAEAIELAAAAGDRLDLVISDVVMPKMDGPTLIGRLRSARPGLRAILMSGYTGDAMTGLTGMDAATPFLEKPFSVADLAARVRETLDAADDTHP